MTTLIRLLLLLKLITEEKNKKILDYLLLHLILNQINELKQNWLLH